MRKPFNLFKILIANILVMALASCQTYKFDFVPVDKAKLEGQSNSLLKNLKKDELYLSFTKSFNQSKIKIYEDRNIIYDSLMPADKPYITKAFKINKNSEVTIYFNDISEPLKITESQMKDYKFIYIEKKRKKVTIEFNNGTKNFDGKTFLD